MDSIVDNDSKPIIDSYFYIGLALFMIVIAIIGFWNNYFGPFFFGTLDAHWLIHVHVVVFGAWLVLFLGQSVLASKGNINFHQQIGSYFGIPWGILLLILGFIVTFAVIAPGVGEDHQTQNYAVPLIASLGDLLAFAILLAAAILYRKNPAIHKRFMVLATASLMEAPVARIAREIGMPEGFLVLVLMSLSPVFIAMGYDRWKRGSIHKVYWIGLGFLLVKLSRFIWAAESDWWLTSSDWLIDNIYPLINSLI
ncbi:hypothetical protein [Fodinibius saliphilus]|uniref:hypothetical protein n=1 Tax=Fodinibius saliphilus TaxID=1920650 RepID=UPI001BB102FC|nr:hypothetical protein [Fodinibius saliphilus]